MKKFLIISTLFILPAYLFAQVSSSAKAIVAKMTTAEKIQLVIGMNYPNPNFKETQLKRIQAGQPAEIELDMYDHKYKGTVQSISYASGNTFSLFKVFALNIPNNSGELNTSLTVHLAVLICTRDINSLK